MKWNILILLMLTVRHIYRMVLQIIQYRSADNPIPANVADVYDEETYKRWRSYNGEKCRLNIFSVAVSYVLMLILLCTGAHAAFASLFPANVYMQLIAVLLLQTVLSAVFDFGFSYAETMIIEEKYGFNRSTMKTFVVDCIRSMVLELVISVALVCILTALHGAMGDWILLLFTAVIFCFTMIVSFLYPIFSRMSNKFVPLEEGELKDRLMGLLTGHGYRVKAIEVMDASRRTSKLNAYFTGFGKMKTIVLYDNLINAMSTDEICAVFSHELGHGLHRDVLKMQIMNLGNMMIISALVWLAVREPILHTSFGFEQVNYGFAYILLNIGLGLIQPLTGMLIGAYSRHAEFRADRQAVKEGYGAALVTGLKKLARENFAELAPAKAIVVLEYSHPPLSARIEALEITEKS